MHTPDSLTSLLTSLGIVPVRHDHVAVDTCEEERAAVPESGAARTKNLFLRDRRGRRHILVVTLCERPVRIDAVADHADADRLSFASPERLRTHLGVAPGSVTLLGLANDAAGAVELLVDRVVWESPRVHAHPLVNTATLVLAHDDIVRFLEHTGHTPRIVDL